MRSEQIILVQCRKQTSRTSVSQAEECRDVGGKPGKRCFRALFARSSLRLLYIPRLGFIRGEGEHQRTLVACAFLLTPLEIAPFDFSGDAGVAPFFSAADLVSPATCSLNHCAPDDQPIRRPPNRGPGRTCERNLPESFGYRFWVS